MCSEVSGSDKDKTCLDCSSGQYQNERAQLSCKDCPNAFYQPQAKQSRCLKCNRGRYGTDSGQELEDVACLKCIEGRWSQEKGLVPPTGVVACEPCPKGRYGTEKGNRDDSQCELCVRGKYSIAVAANDINTCTACAEGKWSKDAGAKGEDTCKECDAGFFQDSPGTTSCVGCISGRVQLEAGEDSCTLCPAGQYQDQAEGTVCITAPTGFYVKGCLGALLIATRRRVAAAAVADTSMPQIGVTLPMAHRRNLETKYQGGTATEAVSLGDRSDVCTENPDTENARGCNEADICPAGKFGDDPATGRCTDCSPGRYSPRGAIECGPCGKGAFGDTMTGNGECKDCPKGWFGDQLESTSCKTCDAGKYTASVRESLCSECLAGKYANDIAREKICDDCPGGYIQPLDAQIDCAVCAAGKKEVDKRSCEDCGKQEFTDNEGSSTCKECESGSVQNEPGQTFCTQCGKGKYAGTIEDPTVKDSDGKSVIHYRCLDCAVGQYQDTAGQMALSDAAKCKLCEIGRFEPNEASEICTECDPGDFQQFPGKEKCTECSPGTFSENSRAAMCDDCPRGWIQPDSKQSLCIACTFGTTEADNECVDCTPGKYADAKGLTMCKDCDPGYFQEYSKMQSCVACDAGQFATDRSEQVCKDCSAGYFAAAEGTALCDDCPSGWVQPEIRSLECNVCVTGKQEGAQGTHTCIDCSPGTYSAEQGLQDCTVCPVGWIQPVKAEEECLPCAAGRDANLDAKATLCTDCPRGYYASRAAYTVMDSLNITEKSECSTCPGGFFQPLVRSEVCHECDAGFRSMRQSDVGDMGTACIECSQGRFAANAGTNGETDGCSVCPNGWVQMNSGSDGCTLCESGTHINGKLTGDTPSTKCIKCEAGTFAPGDASNRTSDPFWDWQDWVALQPLKCQTCPGGWWQSLEEGNECYAAGKGYYTDGVSESACPKGWYNDKPAQKDCQECPKGYAQNGEGTFRCLACGEGQSTSNQVSQKTCELCVVGKFAPEIATKACEDCNRGQYQDLEGSKDCKDCQPGRNAEMKGADVCKKEEINTAFTSPFVKSVRPLNRLSNIMVVELEIPVDYFEAEFEPEDRLYKYTFPPDYLPVVDRQAIIVQYSDKNTREALPEMNERTSWPSLECDNPAFQTIGESGEYLSSLYFFCLRKENLLSYGFNASSNQRTVTVSLEIEAKHKGPIWERPVYIQAAYYLATATTGLWTPTYESAAVATECLNTESNQEYLRTHPSDDTCQLPLNLLQLRTDCKCNATTSLSCVNGSRCKDRSMIKEEDKIKCVSCPDGGNCLTERTKLDDGRIVPRPGMFLWRIGKLRDYWRIPWAPMHGDMFDNDGDFQMAPQFFHPCPRRGACIGINGPPKNIVEDPQADKFWGNISGFPGGWRNSTEENSYTAWSCPEPHPAPRCKEGTTGPLCSLCEHMWVRTAGECELCYPIEARVMSISIAIVVMSILLQRLQRKLRMLAYKYRAAFRDVSRQFVCMLNLGQILVTVTVMLDVPWVRAVVGCCWLLLVVQ
jgi:hypothetical protein